MYIHVHIHVITHWLKEIKEQIIITEQIRNIERERERGDVGEKENVYAHKQSQFARHSIKISQETKGLTRTCNVYNIYINTRIYVILITIHLTAKQREDVNNLLNKASN